MKMQFPLYATTFDGAQVEVWEWDKDAEQWVDTESRHHDPENLHTVTPPSDDHPPSYYDLLIQIAAVSLDGKPVLLNGFRPLLRCWETPEGELHPVVNCPRPVLTQRRRSLDAPWTY